MSGAVSRSGQWRIKPSGKLPIFLRFMINSSFDHKIANKMGFKNHLVNRVFLNHMMYWPAKEYDAFEAEIIENINREDDWVKNYCDRELKKAEHVYKLGLDFKVIDWSKKKSHEIKKILDDLLQTYRELACPWYAQYAIDIYFEEAIEKHLAKYIDVSNSEFRKILLIFTDPKDMTEVAEERWKLMQLAKKFKDNKEDLDKLSKMAEEDLDKHLDKFSYINRGLGTSKPYTKQEMIDRIKETWDSGKDIDQLIYHSSPEKIEEDYKWALKQIKPKKDFKKIIEQTRFHSYTRNRRVEAFFMADYGASFMYREIAKRVNFNPDWIMDVTEPEMYGAIEGKSLPNEVEMKRRFKNYAMVVNNTKTTFIVDPSEIKKMEKKYFVDTEEVDELKGKIACLGGIIKGPAKVCLDKSEIGKIERGDILVAQFTTPDFVPAMEKAAAIVADQGGISSHAAIVSRELGTPCIIGTKNATRVIKDNDILEINAQTGIIKIIKK